MAAPSFKMNFLGVSVCDFPSAYLYYTDVLGVRSAPSDHQDENWAMLGRTWEENLALDAPGMMWEMFGNAPTPPDNRAWGRGQAVRPGIQVESVEKTVAELRDRNVVFDGDIMRRDWGEYIELIGAEGTGWTIGNARGLPYGEGISLPHIGWVEIKAVDLDAQVAFYRDVMGLETVFHRPDEAMLRQGEGEPLILIRPGGEKTSSDLSRPGPPLRQHPVWISFMVSDPDGVAAWFKQNKTPVLRPLTSHPEWGGVDILIADVDGNPIQAVQYSFIG